MKKTYWMILAAGMMCLAACHTEQDFLESEQGQEAEMRTEVITATVADDATKATVADEGGTFGWVGGTDMIAVHTTTGYVTSTAADATGASASFSVTYPYSSTRDAYAIFPSYLVTPSAANYGQAGHTLDVTLPGTYDYAEVSGTNTPCPMIATNTPGSGWAFKQLCGLLRLTVPGIPATADELVITFDKVVTGDFSVTNPASDDPYIAAGTGTSTVSITLTPGTDYSGAVINIPVPQGEDISVTSVVAKVGGDLLATSITPTILSEWDAVRTHGKKATAAFTPSMKSMVLARGNLYTSSGELHIAANYYEHFYTFLPAESPYIADYNYNEPLTYNAYNRTHFNFNEIHYLMSSTGTASMPSYTNASTNGDTDIPAKSDFGDGIIWRLPSADEWDSIIVNTRPGTTLNGVGGCQFVRTFVTDMKVGDDKIGITNSDYSVNTSYDLTEYQYGLLLFPDNIVLNGAYFTTLAGVNIYKSALTYNATQITKANLDLLIEAGCAFLPAAGVLNAPAGTNGYTGTDVWYWSSSCGSSPYVTSHGKDMKYYDGACQHSRTSSKAANLRSVRLVRDL